jgi:arylsulfatase A-like enzyme/Tfp pilus assembly protein PilF
MRKFAILLLVLALGGGAFFFYRKHQSRHVPAKNVLLITIDTLRADHLGCYGYGAAQTPNIDRWAEKGALFLNDTITTPLTLPSHSSIMTGIYPYVHGVRDNGGFYLENRFTTLAETLKKAGFATGGFISAFVLDRRWGIAQGFDTYYDNFELSKYKMVSLDSVQRKGEETLQPALKWIDEHKLDRFFAWIHFYDPHSPYEPPEPFRSATIRKGPIGLYDGEISYVDNLIGRIEEDLKKNDLLENTVIVLTADHGESLGEHEETAHGFFIYDATVHTPLIIRFPGEPPRKIEEQVRSIDLYSTICDAVGVVPPRGVQGSSLIPLIRGGKLPAKLVAYSESYYPRFHYGWSELKSLRTPEYKFIQAPEKEFYRITEDRTEGNNLFIKEQKRAAPFESQLARMLANAIDVKAPQAVDDDSLEKLQALGYIGSASHLTKGAGEKLPDPKGKIRLYNKIKLAQGFSSEDKTKEAFANIQQVLAEDPNILEAHVVLGNLYMKEKKYAEAAESFKRALQLDPEYEAAVFALARAYKEEGQLDAAKAGFERLMQKDPRDSKPYFHLADIAVQEKDVKKALAYLQKVVQIDPDQAIGHNRLGACYLDLQDYSKAEAEIKRALDLNSRIPHAHFNWALIHEGREEWNEAIAEYQKELALFPESYPADFNLSRIYRRQGRLDDEKKELETAIQKKLDFGVAYLYLAKNIMDTGGDLLKAKSLAEEGLAKTNEKSQLPFGHYLLADIYNRLGRPNDAFAQVREAKAMESRQ